MSTLVSTLTAVVLVVVIPVLFGAALGRLHFDYVTRRPDPWTPVNSQRRRSGPATPGVLMMSGAAAVAGTLNPAYWLEPAAAVHALAGPEQPHRPPPRGYRHG